MKMSHFWPECKAIALVFCSKMTKFEGNLKLIDFDCRLKSDENEPFLARSKAIALVFCSKMTKFEGNLKLIDFDCRLKSDENEPFLARK